MNYKIIYPPPQLADFVRFFWFLEISATSNMPFIHHAFAHHSPEIIFCYKGQFKHKIANETETNLISGVYGQTQTFSKATSITDFGIFGFYLYPYALTQLFCLPANELTNQSIDIKTLCGKEGEMLEEKIMLAANNNQRVELICDFLEARLQNIRMDYMRFCLSIKALSKSYQITSAKEFADKNFLSLRQFERKFKGFSGFNPKLFLRITKFNSMLGKPFKNKPLVEIANDYGYYDSSHFTHDFQKFSNHNPKEYFKEKTKVATDRGTIEFEF